MIKNNNVPSYISALTAVFLTTGISLEAVQIIYYILAGLAILFSISFTIWKWYKSALADRKITAEEIADLAEQVSSELDKAKDIVDDISKKD